jgi:hypothetical protein
MQLVLVLAQLPAIYVLAWLISPILVAIHAVVTVGERLRMHVGPLSDGVFIVALVVFVAIGATSRKFLWFGLVPLTVVMVLIPGPDTDLEKGSICG